MGMSDEQFDQVLDSVLQTLPQPFKALLDNVVISVMPYAEPEWLEGASPKEVFGLYLGTPLTERGYDESYRLPDQILIFQAALKAAFDNPAELKEEIRVTLVHELGHFFGLDEDEITEALEIPHAQRKASSP